MPLMSRVASLWRNVVHRDRIERDLDDEVRGVVGLLIDEKIQQGMRPEDARRAAMLELGRVDSVKSQVRDARTGASLDIFLQDVRYGVRSLRRTPGFTLAAVLTLALGIGANTTIFTLLDAVVFKPLPVPAAHELVTLYENAPEGVPDAAGGTGRYLRFSYPRFERLQQAIGTQGSLAAVTRANRFIVRLPGSSQVMPVEGQLVSGSYFGTLGVSPVRGRLLTAGDARVDQIEPVAVISDGFWKRSLGAADAAIGQTLVVNGVGVTVVGVTPPGFTGIWRDGEPDVWLPLTLQPLLQYQTNSSAYGSADRSRPWVEQDRIAWLNLVGRVAPAGRTGVTTPINLDVRVAGDAGPAARAVREAMRRAEPGLIVDNVVTMSSRLAQHVGRERLVAYLSSGFAGLALLLAAVGLYGVLSYAVAQRTREIGVRMALGARRSEIAWLVIGDALRVVGVGLVAGAAAAFATGRMLKTLLLDVSAADPVSSALVLGVLVVVTLAAAYVPARRAARVDPMLALRSE